MIVDTYAKLLAAVGAMRNEEYKSLAESVVRAKESTDALVARVEELERDNEAQERALALQRAAWGRNIREREAAEARVATLEAALRQADFRMDTALEHLEHDVPGAAVSVLVSSMGEIREALEGSHDR